MKTQKERKRAMKKKTDGATRISSCGARRTTVKPYFIESIDSKTTRVERDKTRTHTVSATVSTSSRHNHPNGLVETPQPTPKRRTVNRWRVRWVRREVDEESELDPVNYPSIHPIDRLDSPIAISHSPLSLSLTEEDQLEK